MRIICAPDSFKESMTALAAAEAMARGVQRADAKHECDLCPIADGGEGTMDAIVGARGGEYCTAEALGPLGETRTARYAICGTIGIVELAVASGLALVPPQQRNPVHATTFGTGQLIRHALLRGCERIIIGIGGSATVDGGTGLAQALGVQFWDDADQKIETPMCGAMLKRIRRITHHFESPQPLCVACDVTNPLCGPNGAAAVYGPQKGATPQQVRELDEGLAHLARIVGGDSNVPGSGAAGGAGFGLVNLCGSKLYRGIDLVLDAVNFDLRCRNADLVLTGEGRLDRQSLHGKATMGVARRAAAYGKSSIAIVGSEGDGADRCLTANGGYLSGFIALNERFGLERAWREPAALIEQLAFEIALEQSSSSS